MLLVTLAQILLSSTFVVNAGIPPVFMKNEGMVCFGGKSNEDSVNLFNRLYGLADSLDKINQAIANIRNTVSEMSCPRTCETDVISLDGARWRLFWWYKKGSTWPTTVTDVLQDNFGSCFTGTPYCFSKLPSQLTEATAELLAKDSNGNILRWKFESKSDVSHTVWDAFHDGVEGKVKDGKPWIPTVIQGKGPKQPQDSFMYRPEHGVKSLLLDDDNCDCLSTLNIGHGMCAAGHSTSYSKANVYGVDSLFDDGCHGPTNSTGLFLYFRDDDDCINVNCSAGQRCIDGVGKSRKYQCV